jgi:hypothetical protein
MTQSKWEKIIGILLAAILAVLAVLGWVISPGLEQPEARLRERISIDARDDAYLYDGADLYVYSDGHSTQKFHVDGATGNLDGEGTLNIAGESTLTGAVGVAGDLTVSAALFNPGFADETITDGETLTPTVTIYALDSAGAVTVTLAASATEGQLLILIGDDANDIIIADTNIRTSTGGALTINQWDVAGFVYQDAEWIELLLITNS